MPQLHLCNIYSVLSTLKLMSSDIRAGFYNLCVHDFNSSTGSHIAPHYSIHFSKGGSKIYRPTPGAADWGGARVLGRKEMTGQTFFLKKK